MDYRGPPLSFRVGEEMLCRGVLCVCVCFGGGEGKSTYLNQAKIQFYPNLLLTYPNPIQSNPGLI
jgi:hypothetical protein